ncbi:uncharacterized protein A4U43_C06F80 [Asparagus officinalis]|uniref:Translation initiation factor IF-2, chloroplastic n=1 Tax=Asparagus officinalis TaxID=4686 RepID=A0A5P1EIU9_ASPOF|nr:uncharacterized protein A4U43_C06F80 [Asparagus officinalis]
MASPASLASLGSARPTPCCLPRCSNNSDKCKSTLVFLVAASGANHHHHHRHRLRRLQVISSTSSFSAWMIPRLHWPLSYSPTTNTSSTRICKCMATTTTNLIEEKGVSSSLKEPTSFSSSNSNDDADLVLKPAPKPVIKLRPNGPPLRQSVDDNSAVVVDDRNQVIESLEEVLDKAEKLETLTPSKFVSKESKDGYKPNASSKSSARFANPTTSARKSKTLKSVWRKGNPVANVQKVVKEVPKMVNREDDKGQQAPSPVAETKQSDSPSVVPLRPQMPSLSKPTPKLRAKPAVASPQPPPQSLARKPSAVKDRKPILIDKFAVKKPIVDPIEAEAVLAPSKPMKGPMTSKAKEERRRKSSAAGGLRKRLVDDAEIPDDAELDVPIPGVAGARKGRKWSKASRKASRKAARVQAAKDAEPVRVEILEVGKEGMLAEELAYSLAVSEADILGYLFSKGVRPDAVQTLDKDMVKMICKEYEVEVMESEPVKIEEMAKKKEVLDEDDLDMLEDRPPVITIMGHVDHGKTTLLDYIRKSKVAASEAGGITQGIGAYKVLVPVDGKLQPCVFLDTPGHEAFGAMRARGARVTDITIIVVAADDGVRPQTSEAIAHAKAAGVPIIIAINKIDKDGANPDRVMQELSSVGLMPELWGGDFPMVQISALKGDNVDELLETVMLIAELQELKANPHRNAKGTVIEAGLDKSRGPVATLIVQNGTLKKGDIVVCGAAHGKMRALFDDRGGRVDEAGPSMAVQVIGLSDVPIAGDEFEVLDSLDVARERAETRAASSRDARISAKAGEGKVTLSSIASASRDTRISAKAGEGKVAGKQSGLDTHQLNIILKVDVQGSIEAIRNALQVLPQDNVTLKFLLQAPGDVSTSDVDLAVATEAIIFGFNVKAPGSVKSYANKKNVEIRLYRVIYELINEMRSAMEGLLEPVEEQISIGAADVRAGKVIKECGIRVVRNGKTVHTGKIDSLRRVKEEVKEVGAGLECGIGVDDFMDWEVGDVVEAFNVVKKQRTLEEASDSVTAALAEAGL